jgi:hypothetical protein
MSRAEDVLGKIAEDGAWKLTCDGVVLGSFPDKDAAKVAGRAHLRSPEHEEPLATVQVSGPGGTWVGKRTGEKGFKGREIIGWEKA